MDYLRGILDTISGNGRKSILQLTEESKIFRPWGSILRRGRPSGTYCGRFELCETFTITDSDTKNEIDLSFGWIFLDFEDHNFFQTISIFGHWKNGTYEGKPSGRHLRRSLWRRGISELSEKMFNEETEKMFNEETEKYRQAFLNDDPKVHDQIRAAILDSMYKPVCFRCLNEKTEGHACA